MADMNYGDASSINEAVRVLQALRDSGEASERELAALARYESGDRARDVASAREEAARSTATWRGVQKGATLSLNDEIAGTLARARGEDPTAARETARGKDEAAEFLYPEEFRKGQFAGGAATSTLPGAAAVRAGKGAGTVGRIASGAITGGVLGGLEGFADGQGGAAARGANAVPGAAIGAGIGAVAPVVGDAVGAGLARLTSRSPRVSGYSPLATAKMTRALNRAEAGGEDVSAYLKGLSDEAMLADAPGAVRATAQGLAAMPGAGGQVLNKALTDRAAGAGARIERDVDQLIAQPNAAFDERAFLNAERTGVFGPMYEAALSHQGKVDVSGIMDAALDDDSVGAVRALGQRIARDLEGDVSARRLHNLRSDLSDEVNKAHRDGRTKFAAQAQPILTAVDAELDKIPGYAQARKGYGDNMAMLDAVEAGRRALSGGAATAQSPRELAKDLAALTTAERDAYRKGAREHIEALMGTSRNDAAKAWGEFEKGWNAEKLALIVGRDEADILMKRLRSEAAFSQTRGDVLAGSQTQMRKEAADDLGDLRDGDTGRRPGPVQRVRRAIDDGANAVVDSVMYPGRGTANEDLGRMLATSGDALPGLLSGIEGQRYLLERAARTKAGVSGLLDVAVRSAAAPGAAMLNN